MSETATTPSTDTNTYNVDLMLQVKNAIANEPHRHNQRYWSSAPTSYDPNECGTTYCIAGWALSLSGLTMAQVHDEGYTISAQARKLLGLSADEACDLFYEMDNAEALHLLDEFIEKGKNGK